MNFTIAIDQGGTIIKIGLVKSSMNYKRNE